MTRQSECEHDINLYHIIGGSGLDVTEACGECGTRITHDSPKTKLEKEVKEEAREERKQKRAVNKRKKTIAAKKEAEEKEEDESFENKFKSYFK